MVKFINYILIIILFNFVFNINTHGAIINASDCSQSNVQTAINSAISGDIVSIPAGKCTWSSQISITGKGIILQGAGVDNTNITSGLSTGSLIYITTDAAYSTRITGFTFKDEHASNVSAKFMHITGNYTNAKFRVDHNKFFPTCLGSISSVNISIDIYNNSYGVLDHNTFSTASGDETIHVTGDGLASWSRPDDGGSANAVYIEDNIFTNNCLMSGIYAGGASAVQSYNGGRYVARYNKVTLMIFDAHGYEAHPAGSRWVEIYNNTFIIPDGKNEGSSVYLRGGSGVVFGNTVIKGIGSSGSASMGLHIHQIDRNLASGCCCAYYCSMQIGRGQNDTLMPMYFWNNTVDGQPLPLMVNDYSTTGTCSGTEYCGGDQKASDYIQEGRDYFNIIQKPGYIPYSYPHPLTIPPTPPPSLNVS